MIEKLLRFCRQIARYAGPNLTEAVEQVNKLYPESFPAPIQRGFELGYKRGYADAGEYIADWIEEEEDD